MTDAKVPISARRNVVAVLAISGAVVIYLATQLGALLTLDDWSWDAFRAYFASDQLSYLSIATNVAQGGYDSVEPFTQTGAIHYPHAYYAFLGFVAAAFGITPAAAWAITGIVVQVLLVVTLGIACIIASGKAWTAILAPGPFFLGVFATYGGDSWFRQLDSHGVLWGPFAVLFPLNGEAFGLCLASAALTVLGLAATRVAARLPRILIALAASAAIGSIANVQTYSFLTAVYLATYVVAVYGLLIARRWWLWALSIVALPGLFVVGPLVASNASQLVALAIGLTPAIPGLLVVAIRTRGLVVAFFTVAVAAAAPSVVGTYLGLIGGDPFLVYRVASSRNLGVPIETGILASIAVALPLILVFAAGIHQRHRLWTAYPIGVGVAWILLAGNDRWGANQEPYRMWIDSFMLIATTLLPIMVAIATRYLRRDAAPAEPTLPLVATEADAPAPVGPRPRRLALVGIIVVLVVAVASAADFARFFLANTRAEMIAFDTPQLLAVDEAVASIDDDRLLLVGPCIDPLLVKASTGVPIAWMNYGMAWPEEYEAVLGYMAGLGRGELDLGAAERADAGWLITQAGCDPAWDEEYADDLDLVDEVAISGGGSITLWRLDG